MQRTQYRESSASLSQTFVDFAFRIGIRVISYVIYITGLRIHISISVNCASGHIWHILFIRDENAAQRNPGNAFEKWKTKRFACSSSKSSRTARRSITEVQDVHIVRAPRLVADELWIVTNDSRNYFLG